jgi:hypothetical protein
MQVQEESAAGARPALPEEAAAATIKALQDAGLVSPAGVVELEVSSQEISDAVAAAADALAPDVALVLRARLADVVAVVQRARYVNLYQLLGDNIEVLPPSCALARVRYAHSA